ncbi:MAG: sigma-70 family RNA polymerase sigma factor [Fimbriimonadia bacterium]|jgi:RNA polymerase sigma-70 factor (ECF subfamily)
MAISGQVAVDRDHSLIERCRSGDTAAFDELFRTHKDRVYSVCLGVMGNPDDALDALQDCFSLVYQNIHRFDGRSRFGTWLYRIAVNSSIQSLRKAKARPKTVPLSGDLAVESQTNRSDNHDPAILKALAELAPQDRALVTLYYWQDLALPEIAEIVGCSHAAAKTRLFRARERFKELYRSLNPEAGR